MRLISKAHESEATAATGVTIFDDDLRAPSALPLDGSRFVSRIDTAYRLVNLAVFLELLAQSRVVGVPCKATVEKSVWDVVGTRNRGPRSLTR